MTIIDLKTQIVNNNLENFYIFVGEEIGIINIYLTEMSRKKSLPLVRADSVASIYSQCTSKSMFGNSTNMYVIRDDRDFAKQDKLIENISQDIGGNMIILLFDKLDGRSKLNKVFKDQIVNFEKLTPNVLGTYIKKAIELNDKNVATLMEYSDYSYDICMLDVEKIKSYQSATGKSANDSFEDLLHDNQIYKKQETDIFKFSEAVMFHKVDKALELEKLLRENGNSSVVVLGTLYSSIRSTLLIQLCPNGSIADITGLDKGQIYFNKKYSGVYSSFDLVFALKLIQQVVRGIKSGWIEDEYATRYVLSQIM